ncbi:DUF4199 domain-containing protein [Flavobacterium sp. UBA6135]|jgi:hypothetical protein|uniref:DUF4199 domain-containing protein n=1 Tax=Flavobacterium sp. UBA6135 TaxID=1946553 RepID=UPI0025B95D8A|nr:DUF4199 domain-containing protein [Flavobacterium sp. UBA6135]
MKKFTIEIKWSVVFTLAVIVWAILEKKLGYYDQKIASHASFSFLFALVAFAIYFFAIYNKKKHFFMGHMEWRQGFVSGCVLSVFITVLTPLSQYIIHTAIAPEFFDNYVIYIVKKEIMTEESAHSYYNLTSYITQTVFFALSVGIVTAAIVSFFLKSKPRTS